ncbi:MAG: hypothetical protein ACKO3T_24850, partial [Planctomycetaceae bacterium]
MPPGLDHENPDAQHEQRCAEHERKYGAEQGGVKTRYHLSPFGQRGLFTRNNLHSPTQVLTSKPVKL